MKKAILSLGRVLSRENQKEIKGGLGSNPCTNECKVGTTHTDNGGCAKGEYCKETDHCSMYGVRSTRCYPMITDGGIDAKDILVISK